MKDACPDFEAERAGGRPVIGVDEVGRGPLAGPVVAAAAYLPDPRGFRGLRDSKKLSEKRREAFTHALLSQARVSVAGVPAAMIDELGIEKATQAAMLAAIAGIDAPDDALVIVDGNRVPKSLARDAIAVVKADATCPSVSAAAIVAKVLRDRGMVALAKQHPTYSWHTNKGYGSAQHREAILRDGVTPHHRMSFLTKILS
ncbi:MAG: ribonuclease HII [Pseudomonadota bacterium]